MWGKTKDGRLGLADMAYADPCVCAVPHRIPVVYDYNDGGVGKGFAFAIQDAINDANEGDILEASWGIYYENVTFGDESITLKSEDPGAPEVVADTIIDAAYNSGSKYQFYPAVDFNESSGSSLAGFTLVDACSVGVFCEEVSSVTVMSCVIRDNARHGISLNASSADIQNCEISGNASEETSDYHGVYCISDSDVNVVNCVIAENYGSGISCQGSSLVLRNSIIEDNAGYGIYEYDPVDASVIANSIIRDNGDDGIYFFADGESLGPEIKNNWIYDNGGSGVRTNYTNYEPDPLAAIVNNTIVGKDEYGLESNWATDVVITNCIIWDNGDDPNNDNLHADHGTFNVTYSCLQGSYAGTGGNINGDTCFIDAEANDFHLDANSPCIDAGDPDFEAEPNETDIDGENRVEDGDANGTAIVDMGADEFYWSPADYNDDGIVNFVDYALLAAAWHTDPNDANYNEDCDLQDNNNIDFNDLALFCDHWLWKAGSLKGSMPLMAGRGGAGMIEGLGLEAGLSAAATAERESAVAEPVDIEAIMKWLAGIWLDPEVRKSIDEEKFLKVYESLKGL